MKTIYIITLALFIHIAASAQIRILTIGDSTMANYDEEKYSGEKEQRGWGQLFSQFLKEGVVVDNEARNGRSSKSFYYERWGELKETIKDGDYVIIQFGHNDEKDDGADTHRDDHEARGTNPWGQYREFLKIYVEDVRSRGGKPILATPVVRRMLEKGKIEPTGRHSLTQHCNGSDSLLNYPLAMKSVAIEMQVPLIDMTTLTQNMVEEMGTDKAAQIIYINADKTHLKAEGARLFAQLMAEALKDQDVMPEVFEKDK